MYVCLFLFEHTEYSDEQLSFLKKNADLQVMNGSMNDVEKLTFGKIKPEKLMETFNDEGTYENEEGGALQ